MRGGPPGSPLMLLALGRRPAARLVRHRGRLTAHLVVDRAQCRARAAAAVRTPAPAAARRPARYSGTRRCPGARWSTTATARWRCRAGRPVAAGIVIERMAPSPPSGTLVSANAGLILIQFGASH